MDDTCKERIASGDLNLDESQCILFTARRTLSMIFFIFIILIYVPLMCYGVRRIYIFRDTIVMQKRHVILSQILSIGYIIQILNISLVTLSKGSYIKWSNIGAPLYIYTAAIGVCLNYITAIKIWIHYYDITFNRVLMLNSWTSIIDIAQRYTFWIKNKNRWGNIKFVSKRVLIFGILIFIIVISITAVSVADKTYEIATLIQNMIIIICLVIPIGFALIIGVKLPAFHDHFSIKNETKYICYTVVSASIFAVFQQFTTLISQHVYVIGTIILWFVIATAALIINYFVTFYVVKHNNKLLKQSISNYQSTVELQVNSTQQPEIKRTPSVAQELYTVMNDLERIELLGDHLVHEFSIELLASSIEFIQYKRVIKQFVVENINNENQFDKSKFVTNNLYVFHSIVPNSNTVYGELNEEEQTLLREHSGDEIIKNKIIDFMIRAYNIYKRYIAIGAMYEINLSDERKDELIRLMRNRDEWLNKFNTDLCNHNEEQSLLYLFNLFDSSIDEMKELLEYSFVRLRASNAYKKTFASKQ